MRRFYLLALMACSVVALVLLVATPSEAIHKGAGTLVCGQCHTMHNSQGNSTLDGDSGGSVFLLRGTSGSGFCLECHAADGAQQSATFLPHGKTAPKVLSDNGWTDAEGFDTIGAGGDFRAACGLDPWDCDTTDGNAALGRGHSLGKAAAVAPGSGDTYTLQCTTCHDPHGTDNPAHTSINIFRNLKMDPDGTTGAGETFDLNEDSGGPAAGEEYTYGYIGGTTGTSGAGNYTPGSDGTNAIWPAGDSTPTGSADSNQYTSKTAESGISGFCSDCHNDWHETNQAGNASGDDWKRHPVDYVINDSDTSGSGVDTIDWAHYTATTDNDQLPAAHGDGWQTTNAFFGDANNEDKVFCLSCHFAHGGPYYDNLRWDYLSAVGSGSQTAKGVASAIGCQQCHNRGG
jgi:hypothetical protein